MRKNAFSAKNAILSAKLVNIVWKNVLTFAPDKKADKNVYSL